MLINKQNIRLIFGLKLKQLRVQKGMSFAQLSKAAGVSVSYLNEIEKGKKYPKTDKIIALAQALGVSYDQLVSLKLSKKMAPITELLNSGILESLPLELFGLDPSTLLELISNAPTKINAFISTILKIARNYEMTEENFFFAALRSFQEMKDNYFEGIEEGVFNFLEEYQLDSKEVLTHDTLKILLTNKFDYRIEELPLGKDDPLSEFRSVFFKDKKLLLINPNLSDTQKCFLLGKELGFNYLKLSDRPKTSTIFEVKSFEEVLNNFRASYFSVALRLNRDLMKADLEAFFSKEAWDGDAFLELLDKYKASPEMFLSRMTNLLPKYFDLDNIFFLRFNNDSSKGKNYFSITKEIHLNKLHSPHRNDLEEHYCRRWISIKILQELKDMENGTAHPKPIIRIQRSRFGISKSEYFCFSIAKPNYPTPKSNVSVTLGIFVDNNSKKKINFLDHPDIPIAEVGETCQRCSIADCAERASPPLVIQKKERKHQINKRLRELSSRY
ncbi:MAG: XRE family transcriptional regulator [Bacteroidia bacterium]|nr:XRE family transcriptional regulator [Bacteroidia bacterium]